MGRGKKPLLENVEIKKSQRKESPLRILTKKYYLCPTPSPAT